MSALTKDRLNLILFMEYSKFEYGLSYVVGSKVKISKYFIFVTHKLLILVCGADPYKIK